MILIVIAAIATVLTFTMPILQGDGLLRRMNNVALERSKIRAREREKAAKGEAISLRQAQNVAMKKLVDMFNLGRWLGTEDARSRLMMAGYRSPAAMTTFLIFRAGTPLALFAAALFYVFVVLKLGYPPMIKLGICIGVAYIGLKAPELFLKNGMQKRQLSIRRAWPDALDLLLICVESGMSIEHSFRKVSGEVATASVALAEELSVTTAELSYLPDRRQAFENLSTRTGLDGVKAVTTALVQAERYGTPLGHTLRVLAQENRDMRMLEAEKKAAALPPMLTVPMIIFFLPVLFVVIMGPAIISVMGLK
jgi:tight adherence protein C